MSNASAANPTRRNTVPVGPSSANRPFAMAAPNWTTPMDSSTRPVGGTAPAASCSRPKLRTADGLPFGGIFEPSVVCVSSARRSRCPPSEARPSLPPAGRLLAGERPAAFFRLLVSSAHVPGEEYYRRAQGDDDKEGTAEPNRLRDEPDGRGTDEESEVTGGRDGRDGRSCGRAFRPPRRAEGRREDDREPESGAAEAHQSRRRVRDREGDPEAGGRDGGPGPHERYRSEARGDPVPEETPGDHGGRERGEPGGGESGSGPERAVQVDGAPVCHRALAEQDAEGDHPEPRQRPRRPGKGRLPTFSSVDTRRQHPPIRDRESRQRQASDAGEVRRHADARSRDGTTERRSRKPAEAERGMEG